jgi:hypothetical protein
MNIQMQKANMLAENINKFINFVYKNFDYKNNSKSYLDKIYQLKMWIEDFRFQSLADELMRVNQVTSDEQYIQLLVDRFRKGIMIIDEYVERNYEDLYIFTAQIYTLKNQSSLICSDHPEGKKDCSRHDSGVSQGELE